MSAKIVVCPFDRVEELVRSRSPVRIVSLLEPESAGPYVGPGYGSRHLRLSFHDVEVGTFDEEPPTEADVVALLAFVAAWEGRGLLLIHCRAGVSRSPAAALAAACALRPTSSELALARALRRAAPFIKPNRGLLRLADAALAREGRILRALEQTEHEAAYEAPAMPFELDV